MLYVHKNTIKYRLQLSRELTGLHRETGEDQMLFRNTLTIHDGRCRVSRLFQNATAPPPNWGSWILLL